MSDHGLLSVRWSHTINDGDLAPRELQGPRWSTSLALNSSGARLAQQDCALACSGWLGIVTEGWRGVSVCARVEGGVWRKKKDKEDRKVVGDVRDGDLKGGKETPLVHCPAVR